MSSFEPEETISAQQQTLESVDAKMRLNNDKLDTIVSNTANIKASIEVGGDLYVSQDEVEAKLDTIASRLIDDSNSVANSNNAINTNVITANSKLDTIITNTAASSSTGLATEAKQDVMEASLTSIETDIESTNTKLDTISSRLIDDSNSVANSNNAINSNVITQNNNFHNKVAFIQASVDAESSPPSASTEILLTEDVPMLFKMTALTTAVGGVETAITTNTGTLNSVLTTIDTDTGNIDTKLGVLNTTTSANNTIQAEIVNKLSQNGDGTGNGAGVILDAINTNTITQNSKIDSTNTKLDTLETTLTAIETDVAANEVLLTSVNNRLFDDNKSVANAVNSVNTNTITTNSKLGAGLPSELESGQLKVHDDDTKTQLISANTKLDTLETTLTAIETDVAANEVLLTSVNNRLFDDNKSVANAVNSVNTNTIANNGKLNDINFNLAANNLVLGGGLPSALNSDQLKVSDSSAHTKLDTLETTLTAIETDVAANEVLLTSVNNRLFDDNKSVANAVNSVNTNLISVLSKLDTMITHLATIAGDTTSLDGKLSASDTSNHYGNS